jgi:hypothetical protein
LETQPAENKVLDAKLTIVEDDLALITDLKKKGLLEKLEKMAG